MDVIDPDDLQEVSDIFNVSLRTRLYQDGIGRMERVGTVVADRFGDPYALSYAKLGKDLIFS